MAMFKQTFSYFVHMTEGNQVMLAKLNRANVAERPDRYCDWDMSERREGFNLMFDREWEIEGRASQMTILHSRRKQRAYMELFNKIAYGKNP